MSLYGVSFILLNDPVRMLKAFDEACETMGATILHKFHHKFSPQGVTIFYALAESHISAHTFPERGSASLDCYTCGSMDPKRGMEVLVRHFDPSRIDIQEINRDPFAPDLQSHTIS